MDILLAFSAEDKMVQWIEERVGVTDTREFREESEIDLILD